MHFYLNAKLFLLNLCFLHVIIISFGSTAPAATCPDGQGGPQPTPPNPFFPLPPVSPSGQHEQTPSLSQLRIGNAVGKRGDVILDKESGKVFLIGSHGSRVLNEATGWPMDYGAMGRICQADPMVTATSGSSPDPLTRQECISAVCVNSVHPPRLTQSPHPSQATLTQTILSPKLLTYCPLGPHGLTLNCPLRDPCVFPV